MPPFFPFFGPKTPLGWPKMAQKGLSPSFPSISTCPKNLGDPRFFAIPIPYKCQFKVLAPLLVGAHPAKIPRISKSAPTPLHARILAKSPAKFRQPRSPKRERSSAPPHRHKLLANYSLPHFARNGKRVSHLQPYFQRGHLLLCQQSVPRA